ncbi:MAG: hypothetical protein JW861_02960 [Bacteroidales bacterium]|nr:hypothetical protein [Bacteroidales bacterium]
MKKAALILGVFAFILVGIVSVDQVSAADYSISVYDDPPKKDTETKKDGTCGEQTRANCQPSDCGTKPRTSSSSCCSSKPASSSAAVQSTSGSTASNTSAPATKKDPDKK